jgi:type I restriction enzyme, R subunit
MTAAQAFSLASLSWWPMLTFWLAEAERLGASEAERRVFDRMLKGFFVDRMEGNEEIFDKIMNDPAFRNLASEQLMREVERLRKHEPPAAGA